MIEITGTELTRALTRAEEELAHAKAEYARAQSTSDAMREPIPFHTKETLEREIARLQYNLDHVKREAADEQNALPTPEAAHELIAQLIDTSAADFKAVEAAAPALHDAYNTYLAAVRQHNENFSTNVRALDNAGIPERGTKLDGKPISHRDDPQAGLTFRYDGTTINYINVADLSYDVKLKHIFATSK